MANIQLHLIIFIVLNITLFSNTQYVGTPQTFDDLKAILKGSIVLKCEYNGTDSNGNFVGWYKDNITLSDEKQGNYAIKQTKRESVLTIKTFVENDSKVNKWFVRTNKPGYEEPAQCKFGPIILKPSPQGIETDRPKEVFNSSHGSVKRLQGELLKFKCIIKPNETDLYNHNDIQWEFSENEEEFSDVADDVIIEHENELLIEGVKKHHRGYYRCLLNGGSFGVLLRVKDPLAPLWPFIGIVSVVIVLVIIILLCEKRQKSKKKLAALNDEENTQVKHPLVQPLNQSSDNENKKRAIKI